MANKSETEEELKERLKKEILEELKSSGNAESNLNKKNDIPDYRDKEEEFVVASSYGAQKNSKVKFKGNVGYTSNEEKIEDPKIKVINEKTKEEQKTNITLALVLCTIIVIIYLVSPLFVNLINSNKKEKKKVTKKSNEQEVIYKDFELNDPAVVEARYPIMNYDKSTKESFYDLEKFNIKNLNNNQILAAAMADTYEGNIGKYNGSYNGKACVGEAYKVSISATFVKYRIQNIFGKSINYEYDTISIPTNIGKTKYTGIWKYDSKNNIYVYYGDCSANRTNILYYDINIPYSVEGEDKNTKMHVYNYVGFAVVNTTDKSYTLYRDSKYTEELTKGTLQTTDYAKELKEILNNYNKNELKKYKYSFSNSDCSYGDYCFLSGEWI